jgi:Na+/melibiose symporter-like transporter
MASIAAASGDNSEAMGRRIMTPRELLALSFLWFPVNMFWTAMLTSLLPHRVQDIVGNEVKGEYLGYISLAGAIATTVIQLVVAPLSDACASRWGRRHPFVFWGITLSLAAVLGFSLTQNFPLLMLSFFGVQLFLNVANGPYQALMPDNIHPSQQGIASAYMGGALLIGQLLGALSLFLRESIGTLGILLIIYVLLVVGMIVTLRYVPDRPAPPEEQLPFGEAMAKLADIRVKENPDFFGLLYSRFFINLSQATVVSFLLYYLQDAVGLGEKGTTRFQPFVLLTATLAGLVGTLIAGAMLKRMTKKRVVYCACAALASAALFFGVANGKAFVLVLAVLFGAGWGTFQAVDWALAVNLLPDGGAARYMAVWHVCMTVPQVIAPLFGKVADVLNRQYGHGYGWRAAMFSTVIYLVIGTLLLRRVNERIVAHPEAATTAEPPHASAAQDLA